jgi:2-keto-4-pentenoate hydratase/2-oxohepta-3-ene-1,7-dioic acid hydratase in catechol pathway
MEFMRVVHAAETRWVLSQDDGLYWIDGDPLGEWQPGEEVCSLAAVRFLPPCVPSKIVAVGVNYHEHAHEMGSQLPEEPLLFLKPPSAILGHRESIIYPSHLSQRVDYEGELAVVMGRRGKDIPVEEALDYVLGYTCANDVTARDLQNRDGQWTRSKGFDTFCPLGPVIRTELDPKALTITTRVNGEIRQHASTSDLIFPVDVLVASISQVMTLEPGDVVLTGTPSGVGALGPGDVVEVEIQGIGTLANPVEMA